MPRVGSKARAACTKPSLAALSTSARSTCGGSFFKISAAMAAAYPTCSSTKLVIKEPVLLIPVLNVLFEERRAADELFQGFGFRQHTGKLRHLLVGGHLSHRIPDDQSRFVSDGHLHH